MDFMILEITHALPVVTFALNVANAQATAKHVKIQVSK